MAITKPLLPPKEGYVEVIDSNGHHVYKPTKATIKQQREIQKSADVQSSVNALLGITIDTGNSAALEFRKAIQLFAATLNDDTTMMEIATVYPVYQVNHAYKTKDIFRYGLNSVGDPQLYQVLQDHTSTEEWTPDSSSSLYKKIGVSEDGIPIWVQPLGATDAYSAGDIVMYNGEKYKSLMDANVWSPDAYPTAWEKLDSETTTPDPPEDDTVPEFVQPSGSHDAYNKGDRVMFEGKVYESLIDGNTWSPSAYPSGWQLVE